MSSRCWLPRLNSVLLVGVQGVKDGSSEAAFEAAQRFGGGVADGEAVAVVSLSETVETDLGDSDAVQCGVELSVARASHPDPSSGVARPHRYRCHSGMAGESGLAFESGHPGRFSDELGRGQFPAAGQRQQHRRYMAYAVTDAFGKLMDRLAEADDVSELVARQFGQEARHCGQPVT